MIDHISLRVTDYPASKAFYAAALAPIGGKQLMEPHPYVVGYGRDNNPSFWLSTCPEGKPAKPTPTHVGFSCCSRAAVDAFYEAALAAGGKDNGKPGLRTEYHPNYYAAFVVDPDGHNIEAVCHVPENK